MLNTLLYIRNRLAECLWLRPLIVCLLSVLALSIAYYGGAWFEEGFFPNVSSNSLKVLLGVLTSGMLVIATFATGAMISAYASASETATPRAFPIIVSDDVSQNALSTFVGAFLFAVIALLALMNDVFVSGSRFILLVLTLAVFWIVVLTFIHWVDRIARLGRLGMTLDQVEETVTQSIKHYQASWIWKSAPPESELKGPKIHETKIGYLQRIDWPQLQRVAEKLKIRLQVHVLPGKFVTPDQPLATLSGRSTEDLDISESDRIRQAFHIGRKRVFDEDPRFGFIVLSEIASRALSPAMNDPGTAIQITGQFVRLFHLWKNPTKEFDSKEQPGFDRINATPIALTALFEDAFLGIERNGAAYKEVMVRLQKAFCALSEMDNEMRQVAEKHAAASLQRAKMALTLDDDFQAVKNASKGQKEMG